MSISAWDTKVSMLLSLLLTNIRILSCFFFLLLVMLSNFLIIPVLSKKIKVKLGLAIATSAPKMLAKDMIDTPPFFALKTIKTFSMQTIAVIYLLNFLMHDFFLLISWFN